MQSSAYFRAPWGASLKIMSLFAIVMLLGIPLLTITTSLAEKTPPVVMIVLPLVILVGALLFTIRGYQVSGKKLYVQRLLWRTGIDLAQLRDIQIKPKAMSGSIRTFGNGGLFSFSGRFKNSELGSYRAFATDPQNPVVLKFSNRTIVVTPDRQEEFVSMLKNKTNANVAGDI